MSGSIKTMRRRRLGWVALRLLLLLVPLGLLAGWLAFQYRPDWYRPATLDSAGIDRARRDATVLIDWVGDQMVLDRPFELVLTERQINECLAALPHSWPEARRQMPPGITGLAVRFEEGLIRVGAHAERGGWLAIIGLTLTLSVSEDGQGLECALAAVHGGALPLPRAIVRGLVDPLLPGKAAPRRAGMTASRPWISSLGEVGSVDDLFDGVTVRNRFVWKLADRTFRIASIEIADAQLRMWLEPL